MLQMNYLKRVGQPSSTRLRAGKKHIHDCTAAKTWPGSSRCSSILCAQVALPVNHFVQCLKQGTTCTPDNLP